MIFLIVAAVFFGFALFFFKLSTNSTHPFLGNILAFISAFLVQISIFIYAKLKNFNLFYTSYGIKYALIGGIFIGLYSIFLFISFSKFQIFKVTPVIYIGAISFATILGIFLMKEQISLINITGIILAFIGLSLLFLK